MEADLAKKEKKMKEYNKKRIVDFFGNQKIVWARPGTNNHSANFYGDSNCCPLTQADVLACIDTAIGCGWELEDEHGEYRPMTEGEIVETILNDLQKFAPEDQ
jgi:hypothetical protein